MSNGASSVQIKAWGENLKTVTTTAQSQSIGLPPHADEVGLLTIINQGSASALTVKLQQNLGGTWVDLTGASGTAALDSNATANAEINFATKPNSGNLRVNISAVSLYAAKTVAAGSVTAATDNFASAGHGYVDGVAVVATSSTTLPAPLVSGTTYYIYAVDANNFKLATSYANAIAHTVIDITDTGTGNHTFTPVALIVDARVVYGKRH